MATVIITCIVTKKKKKTIIIIILIYKYGDGRIFVRVVYAGAMHSIQAVERSACVGE
jgi:hypothetical protein